MRTALTIVFLLIGLTMFVGGANSLQDGGGSTGGLVSGPMVMLTTLACLSARTRKEDGGSFLREMFEVIAQLAVVWLAFTRRDLKVAIATDPFPTLAVPLMCFFAYLTANLIPPPQHQRRTAPRLKDGPWSATEGVVGAAAALAPDDTLSASVRSVPTPLENSNDDALYEFVAEEIDCGRLKKGLWTRLLVHYGGDEKQTKIAYIKARVAALKAELKR